MASSGAVDWREEDRRAVTTITDLHQDILLTQILPRLDGPSLASFSCVSSSLRPLCTQQSFWTDICHSTWPSTATSPLCQLISTYPGGPRTFFAHAFATSDYSQPRPQLQNQVISAIDIYYKKKCLFSKVKEISNYWAWLGCRFFVILHYMRENEVLIPIDQHGEEEVSWRDVKLNSIVVDPSMQFRALNVSGWSPVSVYPLGKLSVGETIRIKFATIVSVRRHGSGIEEQEELVQSAATVEGKVEEEEGGLTKVIRVKTVYFTMQNMEGKTEQAMESKFYLFYYFILFYFILFIYLLHEMRRRVGIE